MEREDSTWAIPEFSPTVSKEPGAAKVIKVKRSWVSSPAALACSFEIPTVMPSGS